ncbi:hypothetical protein T10_7520 [Trichinella papuae]|uniref:Uncharacterized protein n=1 Tax=Trichinella papuae TaxID=268474 RepID=A0A0V1N1A2_9BILA|nr:hypothetical protein T10_7520 [Trichinella papuae]
MIRANCDTRSSASASERTILRKSSFLYRFFKTLNNSLIHWLNQRRCINRSKCVRISSVRITGVPLYGKLCGERIKCNTHIIKVKTVESGTVKEGVGISEKLNTNNHISLSLHQIDNMH